MSNGCNLILFILPPFLVISHRANEKHWRNLFLYSVLALLKKECDGSE